MKANDDRYWFPAKRYGWGWGVARCWQGLLVQGGYVALIIASASLLLPLRRKTFWIVFAVSTALLLLIHWLKGEKPAWRWGKP